VPSTVDHRLLAERVRSSLPPGFAETKTMFGGITFLHQGNMLCCASRKGLMVRVGREAEPLALKSPSARRCDGGGREMVGFVLVDATGFKTDTELARWLDLARAYVEALPAKPTSRNAASRKGK